MSDDPDDHDAGRAPDFVAFFVTNALLWTWAMTSVRGDRDDMIGGFGAAVIAGFVGGLLAAITASFLARQLRRGWSIGVTTGVVFGALGTGLMYL